MSQTLDITFNGTFSSISQLQWHGVPSFAVLCGRNGSGKSQLLELIERSINGTLGRDGASFGGMSFAKGDCLRIPAAWQQLVALKPVGIEAVQKKIEQAWQIFKSYQRSNVIDYYQRHFDELVKSVGKPKEQITRDEFADYVELERTTQDYDIFNATIGEAFVDYRFRQLDYLARGESIEELEGERGRPPWQILHEIIVASNLPFIFNDPTTLSSRASYEFILHHTGFDQDVGFLQLSSGEQVLFSLSLWLFHAQRRKRFPRVLLMDEPDAHLHPDMLSAFVSTVTRSLVDALGVRVIMTTQSPVTVALMPPESIFEMFPAQPRVRKLPSKSEAISRLTAGLVLVHQFERRVVIVEDEDDQHFYADVFGDLFVDAANVNGMFKRSPELVFLQASRPRSQRRGGEARETTGSRSEVEKWVPRLREAGLSDEIVGLVDWDRKSESGDGIYLLPRYCLENFLVDPVVVFATLNRELIPPEIATIPELRNQREYELRTWSDGDLQSIADSMHETIRPKLTSSGSTDLASSRSVIEFSNGTKLSYPGWFFEISGKLILRAYQDEFGGQHVNRGNLTKMFRSLNLIPTDLVQIFSELQS